MHADEFDGGVNGFHLFPRERQAVRQSHFPRHIIDLDGKLFTRLFVRPTDRSQSHHST